MLEEKYIPTQLLEKTERKDVEIVDKLKRLRFPTIYVIVKFITFFGGIVSRKLSGKSDIKKTAVELRTIFEELGGLWVKVAQLLALRNDLFPEEICNELLNLQFAALGFPIEQVKSTIESELGVPIDKAFASFDYKPLAAASIAQVHRAVLHDQTPVVVKIQRPGLKQSFQDDLKLIKLIINFLEFFKIAVYLSWNEAYGELESILEEELDYRYEAANLRRMKKSLKKHKIYVPKIYNRFSRAKVLVIEYIDGVVMSDYIKMYQKNPPRVNRWLAENNIDINLVGEQLLISLMRQIFEDNLYHGDLHPGNIMLLRDSRVVLLDMGSVGSLQKELRTAYLNYVNAAGKEDFPKAADYYLRMAPVDMPKVNIAKVRTEIARGLSSWESRSKIRGLDYEEKSLMSATDSIAPVTFAYQIPISWEFLKISRSFGALDGSLKYLYPDMDVPKVLGKYFKKSASRQLKNSLSPKRIVGSLLEISDVISEYNLLIMPQLRQRTLAFGGIRAVNKFALFMAAILRTFSLVIVLAGFILFYIFLFHDHHEVIKFIHSPLINEIFEQFPSFSYTEWLFVFILGGLTVKTLSTLSAILERDDLPGLL